MIESVNNEKVKKWAKLNDKKYQEETGMFLVEGEHLVEEAFNAGYLKEVIALKDYFCDYENVNYVSEQVMRKISVLESIPSIIGVVNKLNPRGINGDVLLLDRISNPGNLGTIIRSAVAFGIDTIAIGSHSVSIYNPKVVRATEGLLFHINIVECDLMNLVFELKEEGYTIYTTDVNGGSSIKDIKFSKKSAIIIGNEGNGVSPELAKSSMENIYIPMKDNCESLNVGVATSIILYELSTK